MLVLFCISLVIGATLYNIVHLSFGAIALVSLLYGGLFCLLTRTKKVLVLGLAMAFTVMLGALRFWMIPAPSVPVGNQAFTGVVKTVDERLDKNLVTVRIDPSASSGQVNVQVSMREKQSLFPGDKVSVRGAVDLPQDFLTETGRTFDYDQYLASRGVEAVMSQAQVVKIKNGGFSLGRLTTSIRFWIAGVLATYITFPADGIVAGMLVGFQGSIPQYLSDIFRYTGTLHTLVLSGYNITVLAGFLGLLLRRIPFRVKTVVIFCGIVALVLVSGAGVSAVRAGVMGSIALVAGMSLQNYDVFRALVLSFLFFFFVSPQTIFVDPGFHLSFLATLFLITLLPILNQKLSFIPVAGKINLREMVILSCGLPIFTLPYIMYFSGLFPLVSPIANIFLVPIIPILMLGGLGVVVFSFIPFVANIFGGLTSLLGIVVIKVLTFFNTLPKWQTPPISGWGVVLIYVVLFVVVFRRQIIGYFEHLRNSFQLPPNLDF